MADSYEKQRLSDLTKKITLIQTVISTCELFVKNPVELDSTLSAKKFFTNESSATIAETMRNPKASDLNQLLARHQDVKANIEQEIISSSQIHNILHEYYVNKRMLLDLTTLTEEMEKYGVNYNHTEILKDRGFIWREIGNEKECILIEDPEVQARRIKYFLDMKRFREDNRIIVYAEEKSIPSDAETLSKFQSGCQSDKTGEYRHVKLAVSPQIGVISLSRNNPEETVSKWLTSEVVHHLKPFSVLVIKEDTIKEAPIEMTPGPESKKNDMIHWLERNNIPCDNTMHRADLYDLIELCKDKTNDKKYLTDEIIKNKGIEIVKIPKGWPELNYFEPLWLMKPLWQDVLQGLVGAAVEKRLDTVLNVVGSWDQYEKKLATKELKLFEKDMELEEVIDKLIRFAQDSAMPDNNLPYIWEVKETDEEKLLSKFSESW